MEFSVFRTSKDETHESGVFTQQSFTGRASGSMKVKVGGHRLLRPSSNKLARSMAAGGGAVAA